MPHPIPCGMDFGTSNTVIMALPNDGPPQVIKSPCGENLHPSAVYFPPTNLPLVVGKAALAYLPHPNVVLCPKRALGITTAALHKKKLEKFFNAKVINKTGKKGTGKVEFEIQVNGKESVALSVDKVIEHMLKTFVELAETQLNSPVAFVLSRPQYWNTEQTLAFTNVVNLGIGAERIVDIITEPTAGQYAYAESRPDDKTVMLIVDLGAGTYDLSMLREATPGNFVGVTTGGDDFLGGNDVEVLFLRALEEEMKKDATFSQEVFDEQTTNLVSQLKEAKHKLSFAPVTKLSVYGVTKKTFTFTIDQAKKIEILQIPFYDRIKNKTNEMFEKKAKGKEEMFEKKSKGKETFCEKIKGQVQIIYPIGGPQRDTYVMDNVIAPMFPRAQIVGMPGSTGAHNPDEVVGIGNAKWCAAKLGSTAARKMGLPEPVHINVLSKSLGVEGISTDEKGDFTTPFVVVIPANTPLPTCKDKSGFSTSVDNQRSIQVSVYQGDGLLTTDDGMEHLGQYTIPIEYPNKMDGPMITIEMEVTSDNLLVVRAGEEGATLTQKTFDHKIS